MFRKLQTLLIFMFILRISCLRELDSEETEVDSKQTSWIDDLLEIDYDVKCKMQPNAYDCTAFKNGSADPIPRYYYDVKMQACSSFDYHECKVSLNNFLTLFECNEHCREAGPKPVNVEKYTIYCRLQPDFGDCFSYHPMYYFDITTRTCKGFSYGGCGGNRNKFSNRQQCVAVCREVIHEMDP